MISRAKNQSRRRLARRSGPPARTGLYDPQFEHDACGVGFVVNIKGKKSHEIIRQALQALLNLDHRGACGCEANTGDGAGILMQMPHEFLKLVAREAQVSLPSPRAYGVGMVFLPTQRAQQAQCEKIFREIVAEEGQRFLGWRDCSHQQCIAGRHRPGGRTVRCGRCSSGGTTNWRTIWPSSASSMSSASAPNNAIRYSGRSPGGHLFYVSSLSCKTLVYKGMLLTDAVGTSIIPDLLHPAMETALALVHSRFSTNTFPSWDRAHPYRYLAHNGEINTLRGNINWMHARQAMFESRPLRR